jgi:hypothetical protein
MFKNSVLTRTGQMWKLVVSVVALLAGSFVPLFPAAGMSWTVGTIVAIGGYIFGMATIRCQNCKKFWFWEASLDAGMYKPLFTKTRCPNCKHNYA